MKDSISTFGLNEEQMRILFSLEYYMASMDAAKEAPALDVLNPFTGDHDQKKTWCVRYKKSLDEYVRAHSTCERSGISTSISEIKKMISNQEEASDSDTWKYLILLECVLFQPYFSLSENEDENKKFKNLKMTADAQKEALWNVASWLGVSQHYIESFQSQYESCIKSMTGYWSKIFLGVGVGVVAALLAVVTAGGSIAAMFAAEGLVGAAAVSSGLAALGGGAVAAGGFGMAGGMAVLIGGGVLLGSGAGATISMAVASTNPDSIMCECAKMSVVLKEIVLGMHHDMKRYQAILLDVVDEVNNLKKELGDVRSRQNADEKRIKNLEKSISYLEKYIKYLEELTKKLKGL